MPAVNFDIVYDLVTGHRIGLERFSTGVVKKINALLTAAQTDVNETIGTILGRYRKGYELDTSVLQRMSVLAQQLRALLSEAYGALHRDLKSELVAVAKHEVDWAAATYSKVLNVKAALDLPSARLLEAIVTARPFEGRILKDWSRQLEQSALHRVIQQINLGLVEGEGIDDIRDRLVEHALVTNKRSAEAVVRTAVNHVTNRAHSAVAKANPRLFPHYRWWSVLDLVTSAMCRARAGQVYETGKGPIPPGHWWCRSTVVYIPRGTTATDEKTYDEWLKKQPADVAQDILGPSRYQLWKAGKLDLRKFVNRAGDELTLEQLKARERAAWKRAGLE